MKPLLFDDALPANLRGAAIMQIAAGLSGAGVYRVEAVGGEVFRHRSLGHHVDRARHCRLLSVMDLQRLDREPQEVALCHDAAQHAVLVDDRQTAELVIEQGHAGMGRERVGIHRPHV